MEKEKFIIEMAMNYYNNDKRYEGDFEGDYMEGKGVLY